MKLIFSLIFVTGLLAGMLFSTVLDSNKELGQVSSFSEVLPAVFATEPIPKESPANRVEQDKIFVYNDKVILEIQNAQWAQFTDTHSMEPTLNADSNAIELVPSSSAEIKVGDIVSYESEYAEGTFIHRVIEISSDENGWYAILKGDNNPYLDPGKIRFSQVRRVVIAIVY